SVVVGSGDVVVGMVEPGVVVPGPPLVPAGQSIPPLMHFATSASSAGWSHALIQSECMVNGEPEESHVPLLHEASVTSPGAGVRPVHCHRMMSVGSDTGCVEGHWSETEQAMCDLWSAESRCTPSQQSGKSTCAVR